MSEDAVIISMPVSKQTLSAIGSTIVYCADCGTEVWLAPSSSKMMESTPEVNYKISCITCSMPEIEAALDTDPSSVEVGIAPGAAEEVAAVVKKFLDEGDIDKIKQVLKSI